MLSPRLSRLHSRVDLRGESGQVFPIVIVLALVILAAGVVVFWIGSAGTQVTGAQTAADAAALAGEQELISELDDPATAASGYLTGSSYHLATVCARASDLADANRATIISCHVTNGSGSSPYDLEVGVRSEQKLPVSQLEGGSQQAVGYARASDDGGAQASPGLSLSSSCVAGMITGAPFVAHGGPYGFFPAPGADFSPNCESRLAGALDRLGQADHLRLVGAVGTLAKAPADPNAVQTLEACAAAAAVDGLANESTQQLASFDLTRPVPGKLGVVSMLGVSCSTTSLDTGTDTTDGAPSPNTNVHLVPWSGGPEDSSGLGLGYLTGTGSYDATANQLTNACSIYGVWKGLGLPDEMLRVALDVAMTESTMGANQVAAGVSYGLFQQQPVSGWWNPAVNEPPETQEMNPELATEMFLLGIQQHGVPGLTSIWSSVQGQPIWMIAQDVQHSGAGEASGGLSNYGANLGASTVFYNDVTSGQCR